MLSLVKRNFAVIGLGLVSNGADGLAIDAKLGQVAEEVYITIQIIPFLFHLLITATVAMTSSMARWELTTLPPSP